MLFWAQSVKHSSKLTKRGDPWGVGALGPRGAPMGPPILVMFDECFTRWAHKNIVSHNFHLCKIHFTSKPPMQNHDICDPPL